MSEIRTLRLRVLRHQKVVPKIERVVVGDAAIDIQRRPRCGRRGGKGRQYRNGIGRVLGRLPGGRIVIAGFPVENSWGEEKRERARRLRRVLQQQPRTGSGSPRGQRFCLGRARRSIALCRFEVQLIAKILDELLGAGIRIDIKLVWRAAQVRYRHHQRELIRDVRPRFRWPGDKGPRGDFIDDGGIEERSHRTARCEILRFQQLANVDGIDPALIEHIVRVCFRAGANVREILLHHHGSDGCAHSAG